jgi:hypothetical protein
VGKRSHLGSKTKRCRRADGIPRGRLLIFGKPRDPAVVAKQLSLQIS